MNGSTRRWTAGALASGVVLATAVGTGAPATALPVAPAETYGGFSSVATASPLKLEIFEPAIPIPTEPQFELDFSYSRVLADSGPNTTARVSAMWPGAAVGEGLKTFGEQLGLPPQLTDGGYPVQANAAYPSDTTQQVQEFFPGMVGRTNAGEKRTVAKVGYTSTDLDDGDAGDGEAPAATSPLDAILKGDLGALGSVLTGTVSGNADSPAYASPMGALSLLIDFDGMSSVSSSNYDGDKVTATATSRIGELRLLTGLIKLTGVNVVTKVVSTVDGGAKTSQTVDIGGMTIAGQKFAYGPEGFTVAGSKQPVPGLPTTVGDLLKVLGVSFETPTPVVTTSGASGSIDAAALRITLDTEPLRSKLPSLPLEQLVGQLPDLPGQANLLKGLLLSLNTFAPRLVLHVGQAFASATTVPEFGAEGGDTTVTGADTGAPAAGAGTAGDTPAAVAVPGGELPPTGTTPAVTTPVDAVSAIPGLPPLGSIPMLLMLVGITIAGAIGWYLRQAGGVLFGGAAACTHGLKAGIPDLRKV